MADLEAIKRVREATGRSVAEIQRALDEAGGDIKAASTLLAQSGEMIVDKKSARPTTQGCIEVYSHQGRIGVMVEVSVETDFAAKSDRFREFIHDLALHISAAAPADVAELLTQPFIKDESTTINQLLKATIAAVGENMVIKRFIRYQLGEE